jgi:glycerophosphoryl diester phosphodiesterase
LKDLPTIIAHRGLHQVHPENSAAAFRAAVSAGIGWIECDVQASIDGVPIILHDETLDRTTNVTGRIDRHRAGELAHIRLRDHNGRPADTFVPLLEGVRNELAGIDATWLVEIKPPDAPQLVARTAQAMRALHRRWIVQSFDRSILDHARRVAPNVERALLVDDLRKLVFGDFAAMHVAHDLLDEAIVHRARQNGILVGAWTVNAAADMRRMMQLGVDRIITDEPILARSLMRE